MQKEASGLGRFQEHRECSEENKEHPTLYPPFAFNDSSCLNNNVNESDRWTTAVSDWIPRDINRTAGRPQILWPEFLVKTLKERIDAKRALRASKTHFGTLKRHGEMSGLLVPIRVTH
uniref:S ribonuclease n=1 Tax=Angiostrongylus cantonensis TaxID=6313 RepID=A0A0K0D0B5_ANGCA